MKSKRGFHWSTMWPQWMQSLASKEFRKPLLKKNCLIGALRIFLWPPFCVLGTLSIFCCAAIFRQPTSTKGEKKCVVENLFRAKQCNGSIKNAPQNLDKFLTSPSSSRPRPCIGWFFCEGFLSLDHKCRPVWASYQIMPDLCLKIPMCPIYIRRPFVRKF